MLEVIDLADAVQRFEQRLDAPLDPARSVALDALRAATESAAMVTVFRRYRDTGLPPDGGRGGAVPVIAAATAVGVVWATVPQMTGTFRKRVGESRVGVDDYRGFDVVTFSMAETLFEGGSASGVSFGTEREVATSEGEYMRALQFTIVCAELGYGGAAKVSGGFPPTPENIADARSALGLD